MPSRRVVIIVKTLIGVLGALFVASATAGLYLYSVYQDLPDLDLPADQLPAAATSLVYASDGSVIAEWHGEQDRTPVGLEDIPLDLREAVVAVEDERFYTHKGVDTEAIARAFRSNAEAGGYVEGGSTITQQLVKLLSGDGERTLARKVREALLAYELEARTDKDKVLEAYLNLAYLGHGWYGVEAAAQNYFGKPVGQLDLAESATLAGIIRSPGRYSPKADPEAAVARRNVVLNKMEEIGYLTPVEASQARASEIVLAPPREVPQVAPYFVEYVKQYLIDELGTDAVFGGGLRVHTTLDRRVQQDAEAAAKSFLPSETDPEVAIVALDHRTGNVLAMVGGRDFAKNQFNLAAQGRRQPGSAFKTFVLVTALERGIDPGKRYATSPYTVEVTDGVWRVENYEGSYPSGSMTLYEATIHSVNAVFARLIMEVGPQSVVDTAGRMGITTDVEPHPAIALGGLTRGVTPMEMASAYGTIASGGIHNPPVTVNSVQNEAGATVWEPDRLGERAIEEPVAVAASKVLHDVVERGTGTAAKFGPWAAGKTGTTQSYRDAWFVGYSGDVATAVWVGFAEGQVAMENVRGIRVTGGTYPAKIWARFMSAALPHLSAPVAPPAAADPVAPLGTVKVKICTDTYLLATPRCPNTTEIYLEAGKVPAEECNIH